MGNPMLGFSPFQTGMYGLASKKGNDTVYAIFALALITLLVAAWYFGWIPESAAEVLGTWALGPNGKRAKSVTSTSTPPSVTTTKVTT